MATDAQTKSEIIYNFDNSVARRRTCLIIYDSGIYYRPQITICCYLCQGEI